AGAIEDEAAEDELDGMVRDSVASLLAQTDGVAPVRAILGCTHFPLVEHVFKRHLPRGVRILSQPQIVSDSLDHYLERHPHYAEPGPQPSHAPVRLLTTGDAREISARARVFWPDVPQFSNCGIL
ncbi:MAG: glutamate racemase, partial [Pseudomonadota bacterium]